MPTYDYRCQACGHEFERFQEMSARKLRTCPECREKKLQRLVGAGAGVIFKGSGFYETDYKRAGARSPGRKSEESASTAESSPSSDKGSPSSEKSSPSSDKGSSSSPSSPSSSSSSSSRRSSGKGGE